MHVPTVDSPQLNIRPPFLRRHDWLAFWIATTVSGIVYLATLAPTVTLEDSGELAVAGDFLGVPHPPGYPIWSILAWCFARIFSFVQFRGQPNPAWSIGLLSAVFGALAAGITAMLICRSGRDILRHPSGGFSDLPAREHSYLALLGGVVGSLAFAFSPAMWSQSTIIEVYSLNAFFLMLIFLFCYHWICAPTDRALLCMAFVFGVGLTNYQVLLLAALPLAVMVLLKDPALFRDLLCAAAPILLIAVGIKVQALPPISHPYSLEAFVYLALNGVGLASAWFFLPRGRCAALVILMAQLGLAFYAYMPLVSDLRNPPMNWAYPRTWDGFVHAITRSQYAELVPSNIFSGKFVDQIGSYLSDLRGQFTLPIALLGFLPLTAWQFNRGRRTLCMLDFAMFLTLVSSVMLALQKLVPDSGLSGRLDKAPIAAVMTLAGIGIVILTGSQIASLLRRARQQLHQGRHSDALVLSLAVLAAVSGATAISVIIVRKALAILAQFQAAGDLPDEHVALATRAVYALITLAVLPIVVSVIVAAFMRSKARLRLSVQDNTRTWWVTTGIGFVILSVFLIVLANPNGDVQDNFIQRVKFISSHALFALWIGYGLIFVLARLRQWRPVSRVLRGSFALIAVIIVLVPLSQNAWNRQRIAELGAAEQTGHDFGWQFGNYPLRGAASIAEELDDEEPLPNPSFPPAMEQDAIFFGGTDPGRFVPTYMIYSARVRPDVYLITQNALADRTYLNVMRDLYGDRIWIPSSLDSERAFNTYATEIRSGVRPPNPQLTVENGQVRIKGVMGVMEINGILARMMFDQERERHAFYVEESYPIAWMYPYLSPHGLILKLNSDPVNIGPEQVRKDTDFWDWYTRRLHGTRAFRRDVVARKSFSKLRSAVAGIYAQRGMLDAAENAFSDARLLYMYSPEATLRLVQGVHVPQRRFADAESTLRQFLTLDPANPTAPAMLQQLLKIKATAEALGPLDAAYEKGTLSIGEQMQLAAMHLQMQAPARYDDIMDKIATDPETPTMELFKVAMLHHSFKKFDHMQTALQVFEARIAPMVIPADYRLRMASMYGDANNATMALANLKSAAGLDPENWHVWLDIALLEQVRGDTAAALLALQRAYKIGGESAGKAITESPPLLNLLQKVPK